MPLSVNAFGFSGNHFTATKQHLIFFQRIQRDFLEGDIESGRKIIKETKNSLS